MNFTALHGLQTGRRFCQHCRQLCIYPDQKEYVVMCVGCYVESKKCPVSQMMEEPAYCTNCSKQLDKEIVRGQRSIGHALRYCGDCKGEPEKVRSTIIDALYAICP